LLYRCAARCPAAPAQDEYYWADLIGLAVVNLQDQPLGRVTSLIETGANQVLVVADGERERLLPFVEHVVGKVDVPGGVIRVDWDLDW
jgi:16S rRNA processing protein RimM